MLYALCDLARRERLVGEPEFEMKPVPWLIHLEEDGRLLGVEPTHYTPPQEDPTAQKKPKEIAKRFLIPRQFNPDTGGARTSGDFAYFLVDKAEYVLGVVPDGKGGVSSSEKSRKRQQLFLDKVRECQIAAQSPLLAAVIVFLEKIQRDGLAEPLPIKCGPSDLFAFKVEPEHESLVHEEPSVRAWWKRACAKKSVETDAPLTCLVTGMPMAKTELFPMIKRVPGGTTSGAGLVSFNARAFESYGWSNSDNAPISGLAAQEASTALNRLLDPAFELADGTRLPKRRIGLAETTVLVFWTAKSAAEAAVNAICAALEVNEDQSGKVGDLVHSIWKGKPPETFDPTPFYAVTLSGAQGRIIVRDWLETTVGVTQAAVASHFAALDLPPLTPPGKERSLPPALSLGEILQSIVVKGDKKRIPPPLSAELAHAVLTGGNYPVTILYRALERQRAEIHDDSWKNSRRRDVCAAISKAFLTRNFNQETHTQMDALNKTPGYLLGRLLACYGEMQRLANLPRRVNATVVDKYYGLFSVSPRPILKSMDALYQTHLRTARKNRSQPWISGRVENIAANVNRINAHLGAENLGRLSPEMQAQFVLGFHHQNHWFQLNQEQRDEWVKARNFDLNSPETVLVHQLATA